MIYLIFALIILSSNITITCFHIKHFNNICFKLFEGKLNELFSISRLNGLNTKEVIRAISSYYSIDTKDLYENVDLVRSKPTVNRFLIANPKGFLDNKNIIKPYIDIDFDNNLDYEVETIAAKLPVIYIADVHPEYGTLGFILNLPSLKSVGDTYTSMKSFRNQTIYTGGLLHRGNSLTMLHKKIGFPDNRAFKVLPGNNDFKLFFSPDVAMANELILTGDAKAHEFKFFEWATVWPPKQLDIEYDQRLWLTINGPSKIIFDDVKEGVPLWIRIIQSLPQKYFE